MVTDDKVLKKDHFITLSCDTISPLLVSHVMFI
jgi:hypothetical protein